METRIEKFERMRRMAWARGWHRAAHRLTILLDQSHRASSREMWRRVFGR